MANVGKHESEFLKIMKISEIMDKRLSPLEMRTLISLIENFSSDRIGKSEFTKSVRLFFKKKKDAEDEARKTRQDDNTGGQDTDLEEGEIREDLFRGDRLEARAKVDGLDKKTRILQSDATDEMCLKRRASRRLEWLTPSYRLILEEEKCSAASDTVLNKCRLKIFDNEWGHKKLTYSEEVMARCEEHMYETDMMVEILRSAEESVEKVMRGELKMKDLGAQFYRCIELMYCGDMTIEIVREHHKKAFPLILQRLKQKLDEVIIAQESWKPVWKQVFEEYLLRQ